MAVTNQQFGCGGLRTRTQRVPPVGAHRLSHFLSSASASANHALLTRISPDQSTSVFSLPSSSTRRLCCLWNCASVAFNCSCVLLHCCSSAVQDVTAQSPRLASRRTTSLATAEPLLFASAKMSIPSIRGTSFALRGASRPVAASAAMRSIARRANSSIALEGQQQV